MQVSVVNVTLLLNLLKGINNNETSYYVEIQPSGKYEAAYHPLYSSTDYQNFNRFITQYNVSITTQCPSFNENDITFILYTRNYYSSYNLTVGNHTALKYSSYDASKKTKILVHGYAQDGVSFGYQFISAYFGVNKDYNIISVDWSKYSLCDLIALQKLVVPNVSKTVGKFINELLYYGSSTYNIHMIGFSIGAQIASFAGKYLKPNLISRITGLDPTGVGFSNSTAHQGLSAGDANFVDSIHTQSSILGTTLSTGNVDFWPNGGDNQPSCKADDFRCSHEKSISYYIDSISYPYVYCSYNCTSYTDFTSGHCKYNDVEYMGEYVSNRASGNYYLKTRSYPPYGLGC